MNLNLGSPQNLDNKLALMDTILDTLCQKKNLRNWKMNCRRMRSFQKNCYLKKNYLYMSGLGKFFHWSIGYHCSSCYHCHNKCDLKVRLEQY